jgi:D-aminoacyl-tRNA deacylase
VEKREDQNMRVLLQRVSQASVTIGGAGKSRIGPGLLLLVGIGQDDTRADLEWIARIVASLRIFEDGEGKMNRSVADIGGEILAVSQFTLHAQLKKGNRPSFARAAGPEAAVPLYEEFVAELSRSLGKEVSTGEFGAMMEVALVNDGPVTLWIDSKNRE